MFVDTRLTLWLISSVLFWYFAFIPGFIDERNWWIEYFVLWITSEWLKKKWHGWCNIYVSRLLKLILMCLFNYVEYLWPNSALCYHYQDERRYIRSQLSNPHVSRHRGWRFDRSWHTRLWIRFHWIHDPFSEPNAGIASRANSWTNTG